MAKKLETTIKGRASYPRLSTPDTKFNKAGVYKCNLEFPTSDKPGHKWATEMVERIKQGQAKALADAKAAAKEAGKKFKSKLTDLPYSIDEDTGAVTLNFKMTASGEREDGSKWTSKVAVFDAKGKPMKTIPNVGSGSLVKVSFEFSPFCTALGAGVSLKLNAVQLLELVEFGTRDATGYGFGEEDGYESKDNDEKEDAEEDEDGDEKEDADEEAGEDGDEGDEKEAKKPDASKF